jgi:hypothetical protein
MIVGGRARGVPSRSPHRLRLDFLDDEPMRISHAAIYQALYVQDRGALKRKLVACLRTGRALRVPRAHTRRGKNFVTDQIMISHRSAEAEDRAVPGHWEGDLILGTGPCDRDAGAALHGFTTRLHLPATEDRQPRIKNGPPVTGRGGEQVTRSPPRLRRCPSSYDGR